MQVKATKNNWGPKFELNLPKSSLKLGFLSFFQVWLISFPENCIAWKLGRLLSIIKSKIYEKKIQGPKLYPNSGVYLPFSQGCIISFPWSCTTLQLGEFLTSSRAETSNKKTKKKTKKMVAQIVAKRIFSILMSSRVHSNLFVFVFIYCILALFCLL